MVVRPERTSRIARSPLNGVIIVDKPLGMTSNQVLGRVKRMLGVRKAGFLGTLDPLATGVLPVFTGKATKLIPLFESLHKTYRVGLRLGTETDTLDAEGRVVGQRPWAHLESAQVEDAIHAFAGEMEQAVPRFSAVKIGGRPAYELARRGQDVPQRTRTVRLWDLAVEAIALPEATFRVTCTAGTYMRQLAADIGERLDVGAHVTHLRRLCSGEVFDLRRAVPLETAEAAAARQDFGFVLEPGQVLTDHLPVRVDANQATLLAQGRTVPVETGEERAGLDQETPAAALDDQGMLLAVGHLVPHRHRRLGFRPHKVLM